MSELGSGIDSRTPARLDRRLRARGAGLVGGVVGLVRLDSLVATRFRVPRRAALYRAGDRFEFLYEVQHGSLIGVLVTADGREQVTGFHLDGDWLGLDGIAANRYACDAVALEDSEVCAIPYQRVLDLAQTDPALSRQLSRIMSREIVREQRMLAVIGQLHARERIATFLHDLSERLAAARRSPNDLVLHMKRVEIASFLGLTLETVCRGLSHLAADGPPRMTTREGC
jgi:CRP/FNR family transcriptional regulator